LATEDLVTSITSLQPESNLHIWLQNQVSRATVFPVALPDLDKAFVPLTSSEMIRAKALEYRNCLRSRLGEIALGRTRYVEFQPSPAIIELTALSEGRWACFDKIYGPRNARPTSAGVLLYAHHDEISRWSPLARWLGVFDRDEAILDEIFDMTTFEDAA
jgi:hypothetical protein